MNLLYGQDDFVAGWVATQLRVFDPKFFHPCYAIGIQENGILRGGVIYNNYRADYLGKPISIEISGASIDKRCALRHIIKPLLAYPFSHLMVGRVQFTIPKPNKRAREFAERLGFKLEGIARNAHYTGKDAAIYGLLRHECVWLDESRRRRALTPACS